MSPDALPIAVRAYAEPVPPADGNQRNGGRQADGGGRRRPDPARRPAAILVFDCETTVDASQALLFGCFRYYRLLWSPERPQLFCQLEGLFYGDDLAERDPAGYQLLQRYARTRRAAAPTGRLRLLSRAQFVKRVFLPALDGQATVVTFNAPFDLSRIGVAWKLARGKRFAGGFSYPLADYLDKQGRQGMNRYKPWIRVRPLDSRRAVIGLAWTPRGSDPDQYQRGRGAFLDLRTLASALSGESHSLESACQAFGVDYQKRPVKHGRLDASYIDYCREDVTATAGLYQALAAEYEQHRLQRPPPRVYSPASLAKAYLAEAGIRAPLARQPSFPKPVLGYAMAAYYGGRAECRLRRLPVPVSYLDFASMYATVSVLLGLWRFWTCKRIRVVEADPAPVQKWLAGLQPDDLFDPEMWPRMTGLALVAPDGELLPVRARYTQGGSYGIGVNPLSSSEPLWYPLPDLAAATLQSGRPPRILRLLQLQPAGEAAGLRPISIRGSRPTDPHQEDFFQALVEDRYRLQETGDPESARTAQAIKTTAAAASYGITVELNRREPQADPAAVSVHGLSSFPSEAAALEEPGSYFFPPLAALVTGAARLMLALLERCVTDRGGCYAFCDTDSMAILAARNDGTIPSPSGLLKALSWADVDQIIARFAALNPYNPLLVPSILRLEPENYDSQSGERRELSCYAISAKRYCLYTLDPDGQPELIKWSEHALGGFYQNPTDPETDDRDWVRQLWEVIVREDARGLPAQPPAWLDRPALTRFTASHPRLLKPFARLNQGKPYPDQIKPANFLLVAHPAPGGHPPGTDPARFALIAPYNPDPATWTQLAWRNVHDPAGPSYRISGETLLSRRGHPLPTGVVGVRSYHDILDAYRNHPEPKSLAPDGHPCHRATTGLLQRRPIQALSINHIGKETNLLDEIQAGLIGDQDETLTEYVDLSRDPFARDVLPILRELSPTRIARDTGLNLATVKRIRSGRVRPSAHSEKLLTRAAGVAGAWSADDLRGRGMRRSAGRS